MSRSLRPETGTGTKRRRRDGERCTPVQKIAGEGTSGEGGNVEIPADV